MWERERDHSLVYWSDSEKVDRHGIHQNNYRPLFVACINSFGGSNTNAETVQESAVASTSCFVLARGLEVTAICVSGGSVRHSWPSSLHVSWCHCKHMIVTRSSASAKLEELIGARWHGIITSQHEVIVESQSYIIEKWLSDRKTLKHHVAIHGWLIDRLNLMIGVT